MFAAFLMFGIWLVGVGVLAAIVALLRTIRRDGDGRAWWGRRGKSGTTAITVLPAVIVVALVFVAARIPGGGDETNNFVSFGMADAADPDWSPDGRSIAFATTRGVNVIRPDGTAMRRVFRGEASDVDWSPDGKSITFASEHGIYVLRIREGKARLVLQGSDFALLTWAPNGRELAVAKDEPGVFQSYDGPIEASSAAIYVVRLDGSGRRRLLPRYRGAVGARRPGSICAASETEPAWSPDGNRIAFQACDGVIVAADVKSGRRVTINQSNAGYEPAWSPDGRLIAYQCEGDVCVANADGSGGEHRVASGGGDPSWSPDSRLLVFEYYLYGRTGESDQGLRKLTLGPSS